MSISCPYLNCEDTFECRNLLRAHIGIHKASTNGEYNFACIYIYIYILISILCNHCFSNLCFIWPQILLNHRSYKYSGAICETRHIGRSSDLICFLCAFVVLKRKLTTDTVSVQTTFKLLKDTIAYEGIIYL